MSKSYPVKSPQKLIEVALPLDDINEEAAPPFSESGTFQEATDKDSGIVNDANAWAVETMGNAKYPLELFMRVITVSLETMKIVRGLPGLEIG